MIWLLALFCLGIGALVGYYQGPIRGAFSLIGLFLATMLTRPLAPLIKPLLPLFGVKNPFKVEYLPMVIVFILILIICAIIASAIHDKITTKYKYDRDDNRYYRWERMSARVGLCVGIIKGAVYFIILLLPIYIGGYFTTMLAPGDSAPPAAKMLNSLRQEIQQTKIDRVLATYDPTPTALYKAADVAALIVQNPLLESRVAHYPLFLSLAERKEFQSLAADVEFQNLFIKGATMADLLNYPKVKDMLNDPNLIKELAALIAPSLDDLEGYLKTGQSAKYDEEKLLGIWVINPKETFYAIRNPQTNLTPQQVGRLRASIMARVSGLSFTVTTDNMALLKKENPANPFVPTVIEQGTWRKSGDTYDLTLPTSKPETVQPALKDNRLFLPRNGEILVFDKE